MKAIDLIRFAMELTDAATARIADDMRDAALTQPGGDGNHTLWLLGHLAYIEADIPRIFFGEATPIEHWPPLFATPPDPRAGACAFLPFDEVLGKYRQLRARNLRLLDEVGEDGLDRLPTGTPPGFEDAMKTFGHTFL